MTGEIRTFIAIDLPPEAKDALDNLTQSLKSRGLTDIRWVKPQGIHLTLKFLGNVLPSTVPLLLDAIESAAPEHPPFTLSLGSLGVFPNPNNPRVLWVGLDRDLDTLSNLQASVEDRCRSLGFDPEHRPFRPHLTLGRVRRTLPQPQLDLLRDAIQDESNAGRLTWTVREFHLIHSTLTPQGAIYRSLGSAPLSSPPSP